MSDMSLQALAILLGDDFDQLRPLGADGGLSRLFRARKRSLNVDVVIKRMRMDPSRPADVQREARIITALRHQYLPRIFDFKTDGQGWCYTIMEYIPGCTLRQYVQSNGALDQRLMLRWLRQLCVVLDYMHGQKPAIIHSDIKPENIMITPQGDICLIDFNTSVELKDEGEFAVGATRNYAAPEQYNIPLKNFGDPAALPPARRALYDMAAQAKRFGKVTEKTDIYSMGAVAYFMITGYDPACWNEELIALDRYAITLGDPLRQVIERCMRKEPAKRFSSAAETMRALNDLKKTDKRYRAWRRSCTLTAIIIGAGVILSAFAAVNGFLGMKKDTADEYAALILQAEQAGERFDFDARRELLLEAIGLERERPEAYAQLGALLYDMGDYRQAIDLLTQVSPDGKGSLGKEQAEKAIAQIQYVLASCHYQLQDYSAALECYRLAAELSPEQPEYQRDLAVCYARNGYVEKAEEVLALMSALKVRAGDTELAAGEIAISAGKTEEALTILCKAAELTADAEVLSRAAIQASQCCRLLGEAYIESEIEILRNAVSRLDAGMSTSHVQLLGEAWMRMAVCEPSREVECWENALASFDRLVSRGQAGFAARQNAALCLEYLDRFDEAEAILLQLRSEFPQDYRPPMRLALLYADWEAAKEPAQRSYDNVKAYYEEAKALFPASRSDGDMVRLEEMISYLGI